MGELQKQIVADIAPDLLGNVKIWGINKHGLDELFLYTKPLLSS